jgi:hypothetical protein
VNSEDWPRWHVTSAGQHGERILLELLLPAYVIAGSRYATLELERHEAADIALALLRGAGEAGDGAYRVADLEPEQAELEP